MSDDDGQCIHDNTGQPSRALDLEPLSDPPQSLKSDDLRAIENVMGVHQQLPDLPLPSPTIIAGFQTTGPALPIIEIKRATPLSGIRLETPMLPSSSSGHMVELNLGQQLEPMPVLRHDNLSSSVLPSDHFSDDTMQGIVAAAVDDTLKNMQQEQLQPAEATARFDIPVLDCTVPPPLWVEIGDDIKRQFAFLWSGSNAAYIRLPPLPRDASEIKLGWMPMRTRPENPLASDKLPPVLPQVLQAMPYWDDDSHENPFLRPRLAKNAALDDDDDDDEGVCQMLPTSDDTMVESHTSPSPPVPVGGLMELALKRRLEKETEGEGGFKPPWQTPPSMLANAGDTATDRLMGFMVRAGMDLSLLNKSKPTIASTAKNRAPPVKRQTTSHVTQITANSTLTSMRLTESRPPLPEPPLNLPEGPFTFISSLSAIQLTRDILKLWPSAHFIDRDYTCHDTVVWAGSGSTDQQTVVSPLSYEADIIVSPLTGIIATNVISIMQRAPAGSKLLTPIFERVRRVAPMYDRLVLLVSEGNDGASSIGTRELAAYTDLVAWATALPWTVTVSFVGGGKEALARWAAAVMCQHVHEGLAGRGYLIATETSWEVLFRRAGMNTYTAQLVVSAARGAFGDSNALAMLLAHTPAERAGLLRGLLGKTDVVERAWPVLDQRWGGVVAGGAELGQLQRVLEQEAETWDFDI